MNKSEKKKQPDYLALIFLIIQTILIIIAVLLIPTFIQDHQIKSNDYDRQPKITIEGLDTISPQLLPTSINDIERKLFLAVQENSNNIDLSTTVAQIRESSIRTHTNFNKSDLNYLSTIIDIPSINQSYRLFFEYNNTDQNWTPRPPYTLFLITCLNQQDQIIYPDFNCYDSQGPNIYNGIVANYIHALNNEQFSMFVNDSDINILYVNPFSKDYESNKQFYIEQAKAAVESLGVPPTIFTYEFPSYLNLVR